MDALAEEVTTDLSSQITANAQTLLEARMLSASRQITLEYKEGIMFLRGHLASFYQKQVAQETIRHLDGVQQIVNKIEVTAAT